MLSDSVKVRNYRRVRHPFNGSNAFELLDIVENGPLEPQGDTHFDPQIILVLSGEFEMRYQDFSRVCRSGELCLTGIWEPHSARLRPGRVRYLVITMDLNLIGTVSPFHDIDWLRPFLLKPSERPGTGSRRERAGLLLTARRLLHLRRSRIAGYRTGQWLEIHRLLWQLTTQIPPVENVSATSLLQIYPALLLARNEVNRVIPLNEAAGVCGLSRSRFCAVFKSHMGLSFWNFALHGRVVCAARKLLTCSGISMKQIAFEHGFTDVSHFYRSFRKIFGCTPKRFIVRGNGK